MTKLFPISWLGTQVKKVLFLLFNDSKLRSGATASDTNRMSEKRLSQAFAIWAKWNSRLNVTDHDLDKTLVSRSEIKKAPGMYRPSRWYRIGSSTRSPDANPGILCTGRRARAYGVLKPIAINKELEPGNHGFDLQKQLGRSKRSSVLHFDA
mmetsp:Transcript_39391/g.156455  ORF Transcript_39391/g.156455 Transcript_39391/m.156455 type:complete len:152 (-) Transcript_39391:1029-1484(-)